MDKILKNYDSEDFIVKLDSTLTQDDNYLYVEGYATTFGNKDSYGDIMESSVLDEQINNKEFGQKALINHNAWNIESNVGSVKELIKDERGVRYKVAVLKTPKNNEHLIPMLEAGEIKSVSIGFRSIERKENDSGGYTYSKIKLMEISFVNFPANEKANVDRVKHDIDNPEQKEVLKMDIELLKKEIEDYKNKLKESSDETVKKALETSILELEKKMNESLDDKVGKIEKMIFEKNISSNNDPVEAEKQFFHILKDNSNNLAKAQEEVSKINKSMNTISNIDGGYLVEAPTFSNSILDVTYNKTGGLLSKIKTQVVPTKEFFQIIKTQRPYAYFEGELESTPESQPKFQQEKFQNKALSIGSSYTYESMIYQTIYNRAELVNDFQTTLRDKKEYEIINGDGSIGFAGILNDKRIVEVSTKTAGTLNFEDILLTVGKAKFNLSNATFVMHQEVYYKYMAQKDANGRPIFNRIMDEQGLERLTMQGFPLVLVGDYQLPSGDYVSVMDKLDANGNFVTGSIPVIVGNWKDYLEVRHNSVNFIVDPYSKADQRITRVFLSTYCDGRVINPNSFLKIKIS